jgi:DtxR family Mn-dependent transcriptional regulator
MRGIGGDWGPPCREGARRAIMRRARGRKAVRSVVGDYLEAMYSLRASAREAHAVTLAGLFGVSRATASATVGRLERDGLVVCEHRDVCLTEAGLARAEEGMRLHCVTERFLTDILGMGWAVAHEQARQFERGLTPLVAECMDERLARPDRCPHGNPIPRPGLDAVTYYQDRRAIALSQAPRGVPLVVLAISELAEYRAGWLERCEALGLRPGARLDLPERAGQGLEARLAGQAEMIAVDRDLAEHVWVVEEEEKI